MSGSLTPERIRSNRDCAQQIFDWVGQVSSAIFLSKRIPREPQDRKVKAECLFRDAAIIAEKRLELRERLTVEAIELIDRGRVIHGLSRHGIPLQFPTVHSFASYAGGVFLGGIDLAILALFEPEIVADADDMDPAFWQSIADIVAATDDSEAIDELLSQLRGNMLPREELELFATCAIAVREEAAAALECYRSTGKPAGGHFHPIFPFAKDLLSRSNGAKVNRADIAKAYIASLAKVELAKLRKERPGKELQTYLENQLRNHKAQWNP